MNAKSTLARPHVVTTIVAAALAALIAIGLLTAVTGLFLRDGAVRASRHRRARLRRLCVRIRARDLHALIPRRITCPERREPLRICAAIHRCVLAAERICRPWSAPVASTDTPR